MQKILIVGATSAIAEATARRFAARGAALFLAGRNAQRLEAIAADLRVRGAGGVALGVLDCNDFAAHAPLLEQAEQALGGLDVALIAHGTLPDQQQVQDSVELSQLELRTNGLSVIALCTLLAPLEARRQQGAQGDHAEAVGAQLELAQLHRVLHLLLVRQGAMGDQCDIEPAEGLLGLLEQRRVRGEVVAVQHGEFGLPCPAYSQVVGDGLQPLRVAAGQKQLVAARGEAPCRGLGDSRGGADDQDIHVTP